MQFLQHKGRTAIEILLAALVVASLTACGASPSLPRTPLPHTGISPHPAPTLISISTATPSPRPAQPTATAAFAEPTASLRVISHYPITDLNPITAPPFEAAYLANVYETLVRVKPNASQRTFVGLLADHWEHDPSAKVWLFHLRKGVTFHDGSPLTAAAARASLLAARRYSRLNFPWKAVDKIEVVDNLTLRFRLNKPTDLLPLLAASSGAYIVSPKAIRAWQKDAFYFEEGHDGGTGPYTIKEQWPTQHLTLSAYQKYWQGWRKGQAHQIEIYISSQPSEWHQLLTQHKADLAMPFYQAERHFSPSGYQTVTVDSFVQMLVLFNTKHKPLDDPRVRRALAQAISSDQAAEALGGWAKPARAPLPPGLYPLSPAVKPLPYDPGRARQTLRALNADGLQLTLTYASESPAQAIVAKTIQKNCAEIGVQLALRPMTWREQWENARSFPEDPATQDLFLMEYAPLYPDGNEMLRTLFGSSARYFLNLSYWNNEEFDHLLAQGDSLAITDPEKAREFYARAMNLLINEAPAAFLLAERPHFLIANSVHGFSYNPYYPDVPIWFARLTVGR